MLQPIDPRGAPVPPYASPPPTRTAGKLDAIMCRRVYVFLTFAMSSYIFACKPNRRNSQKKFVPTCRAQNGLESDRQTDGHVLTSTAGRCFTLTSRQTNCYFSSVCNCTGAAGVGGSAVNHSEPPTFTTIQLKVVRICWQKLHADAVKCFFSL